ncbi:hypothetical protein GpartN1_g7273.t1 [Galdieria partita]|uniref:G domain-containing protein n=1 Tax=Galdieria partita TaxID=83374 RepID=A0A9C7Q4S6_9RHOD|nr:hypothetical protein GpartN1_g7273.t1 [Galdieria partita]
MFVQVELLKSWILSGIRNHNRRQIPLYTCQRMKPRNLVCPYFMREQVDRLEKALEVVEMEDGASETQRNALSSKKKVPRGSRCPGCGCLLQTTDKDSFGYVPEWVEYTTQDILCKRCFQIRHYGKVDEKLRIPAVTLEEVVETETGPVEIVQKLKTLFSSLSKEKFLILLVLDIFDLCGSLFSGIQKCLANADLIICVNKIDLLPEVDCQSLVPYLKETLQRKGLENIQSIRFVSCKTGRGIQSLRRELFRIPRGKRVFVVGVANVGKSSILNQLKLSFQEEVKYLSRRELNHKMKKAPKTLTESQLKNIEKSAEEVSITTSVVPGTTLEVFPVKIGKGYKIYDTPGLFLNNHLSHLLSMEELKLMLPQKAIRPASFRFQQGQYLFLGGLARIHFVEGKPFLVVVYTSSEVTVHVSSCRDSEQFLSSHVSQLLKPPLDRNWIHEVAIPWETSRFSIQGKGWKESAGDIAIAGLGWISFVGCGKIQVDCIVPHGIRSELRDPLLPHVRSGR